MAKASHEVRDVEERVHQHFREGRPDAAVELAIESWQEPVRTYLRTMLGEDEAEDALSIWRTAVWKDLPRFEWRGSLRGWMYKVARRAATRIFRQPHRRREQPLPSSAGSHIPATSRGPGSVASGRHAGLDQIRRMLGPEDQELLTLRIDAELEWEEIAEVLRRRGPLLATVRAAALRKRYERLTRRLERMAREQGLVD